MHRNPLTPTDIEHIHADIHSEYPGTTELTDNPNLGYTTQAISRKVMGEERSIPVRAASLLRFLVETHPFPDGNKRTAYNATAVFLGTHGFEFDPGQSIRTMLKVLGTDSELPDDLLENYIVENMSPPAPDSLLPQLPGDSTPEEKRDYARAFRNRDRDIFDALSTE